MELYYLFGIGVVVLGVVIYLFSKSSDDEIEDALRQSSKGRKKVKSSEDKNSLNLNKASSSAKSGNILDEKTTTKTVVRMDSLARWVDSDEYDEPGTVQEVISNPSIYVDSNNTPVTNDVTANSTPKGTTQVATSNGKEKLKILLVDDSLTVRTLLGKLLLKMEMYEVILKENGLEALEYLNSVEIAPDLVITDIQMPEMDGFELIDEIRKKVKFHNMPVVAISSVFEPEDHLELLELEKIQGFIKKQNPFDESDLAQQISYLINNF